MVQTIAVSEATLVDDITAFLLEDPDTINCTSNWWYPRIKVLEKWLREDANRAVIPDDGMEEMMRKLIQRGDIYAQSQLKCWKHILLELCDIPSLAMASSAMDPCDTVVATSPSRGKLRPGKELIILSDEINQETSTEPLLSDETSNVPVVSPLVAPATMSASAKKLPGTLSMMERQAEWLRKKEEKLAAEKIRQDEEKQKELTFQPKLLRRATYNTNGERPGQDDKPLPASARSIVVVRSESFGANLKTTSEPSGVGQETRRPPSGNSNARRGSAKSGKKKKFIPVDQRLEVQSDLLETMKYELEASMQRTAPLPHQTLDSENNITNEVDTTTKTSGDLEVPPSTEVAAQNAEPLALQSWQACPTIGGFRVDFDSSDTKARLVLQDASRFELSSMYRKTDRKAQRDGIALHMGRREDTYEEEVIAILFDKEKVSESDAARWWKDHEHRFALYIRDRSSTAANHALAAAVAALSTT